MLFGVYLLKFAADVLPTPPMVMNDMIFIPRLWGGISSETALLNQTCHEVHLYRLEPDAC